MVKVLNMERSAKVEHGVENGQMCNPKNEGSEELKKIFLSRVSNNIHLNYGMPHHTIKYGASGEHKLRWKKGT
jgi:hypothetical protein